MVDGEADTGETSRSSERRAGGIVVVTSVAIDARRLGPSRAGVVGGEGGITCHFFFGGICDCP